MTVANTSQVVVEVVSTTIPQAQVTQIVVEVISLSPVATVSQQPVVIICT